MRSKWDAGPTSSADFEFFQESHDYKGLNEQLAQVEQMEQMGEQYRPFVSRVRALAKAFEMQKIQDLVREQLKEK